MMFHGDARIALEVFDNRDHINPMLLLTLEELSQSEERLQLQNPNVSLIHALQRIATTKADREVHVFLRGDWYQCRGMGLLPWSPSMSLLVQMGIVSREAPFDSRVLPEITFRAQDLGFGTAVHEKNPIDMCVKTDRSSQRSGRPSKS